MTLDHVPGGILSRSFSQWSLNSYAKFTDYVSPANTWGKPASAFLKEPSTLVNNPYVASEAQVKGISLYAGTATTTLFNIAAPSYVNPSQNPYVQGSSTNFSLSSNATDTNNITGSVSPRPAYGSNGFSLSAQVTDDRAKVSSTSNPSTPSPTRQSTASAVTNISPPSAQVPTLTIQSGTDVAQPSCIDAPLFSVGTLNCPVGFQVVLNSTGDEAGCIPTPAWEESQNNVASYLRPPVLLRPQQTPPLDQQWFSTPPEDSLVIEAYDGVFLCQGPYLPAGTD
jgi:hypothetical protein